MSNLSAFSIKTSIQRCSTLKYEHTHNLQFFEADLEHVLFSSDNQTKLEPLLHYSHSNNIGVRISNGIEGI